MGLSWAVQRRQKKATAFPDVICLIDGDSAVVKSSPNNHISTTKARRSTTEVTCSQVAFTWRQMLTILAKCGIAKSSQKRRMRRKKMTEALSSENAIPLVSLD